MEPIHSTMEELFDEILFKHHKKTEEETKKIEDRTDAIKLYNNCITSNIERLYDSVHEVQSQCYDLKETIYKLNSKWIEEKSEIMIREEEHEKKKTELLQQIEDLKKENKTLNDELLLTQIKLETMKRAYEHPWVC